MFHREARVYIGIAPLSREEARWPDLDLDALQRL
jgi:hypothetical protein